MLDFEKTGTGDAAMATCHIVTSGARPSIRSWPMKSVDDGTADDVAWALTDHLNSVRDLVEYNPGTDTASVIKHVTYDAFGNLTSDSASSVESLFLFTARPYDADTQLQNNLNRWYDPATGRWMSTDPIGFEAGDGNLYRYVGSDPLRFLDPLGTSKICKCALTSVKTKIEAEPIGGYVEDDPFFTVATNPGTWEPKIVKHLVCKRTTIYTVNFKCRECPPTPPRPFDVTKVVSKEEHGTAKLGKGIMTARTVVSVGPRIGIGITRFVGFADGGPGSTAANDIISATHACKRGNYWGGILWKDADGNDLALTPTIPSNPFGISCDGAEAWPE